MQKLFIVGNLCNDPEKRSTADGTPVASFTVAVNRRDRGAQAGQDADFFRVTAWRKLAENCVAYLRKGRKVAVTGEVRLNTYDGRDGKTHATMEVNAQDVEFLTPKGEQQEQPHVDQQSGMVQVPDEKLPWEE